MAEENNQENTAVASDEQAPQFQLQRLYLTDVSFEVPGTAQDINESGQSEVKLSLNQRANEVEDGLFEVVLTITVNATMSENTIYLAEVSQAGLFMFSGFNEQAQHAALNTLCPATLFPYACAIIRTLVSEGGFPPLVLQPINFDAIYGQRMEQAQSEADAQAADDQA